MASIENKIRDMMNRKAEVAEAFPGMGNNKEAAAMAQGSSEKPAIQMMNVTGADKPGNPVNALAAGAGAMESKPMKQGSSQDAAIDSEDDEKTQGKTQAAKAKKQPVPTQHRAHHEQATHRATDCQYGKQSQPVQHIPARLAKGIAPPLDSDLRQIWQF